MSLLTFLPQFPNTGTATAKLLLLFIIWKYDRQTENKSRNYNK